MVAPVASSRVQAKDGRPSVPATDAQLEVLEIRPRAKGGDGDGDALFAAVVPEADKQAVPAPAPVAQVAAAPAAAPPPPFRVLGRYADARRNVVFLQQQDKNFVVEVGDTIDGQYKVEEIGASVLTLRYLPINELQTISLGGIQ